MRTGLPLAPGNQAPFCDHQIATAGAAASGWTRPVTAARVVAVLNGPKRPLYGAAGGCGHDSPTPPLPMRWARSSARILASCR